MELWKNVARRRFARLDIGLCDEKWMQLFPDATIKHLPRAYSDIFPILLLTERDDVRSLGRRPFRFQAARFVHLKFKEFIHDNWDS